MDEGGDADGDFGRGCDPDPQRNAARGIGTTAATARAVSVGRRALATPAPTSRAQAAR